MLPAGVAILPVPACLWTSYARDWEVWRMTASRSDDSSCMQRLLPPEASAGLHPTLLPARLRPARSGPHLSTSTSWSSAGRLAAMQAWLQ